MRLRNDDGGLARRAAVGRAGRIDPLLERLEDLRPGRRLSTRDGTAFIRTNRTCMGFCNLETGCLCTAKDLCFMHGGIDAAALEDVTTGVKS